MGSMMFFFIIGLTVALLGAAGIAAYTFRTGGIEVSWEISTDGEAE